MVEVLSNIAANAGWSRGGRRRQSLKWSGCDEIQERTLRPTETRSVRHVISGWFKASRGQDRRSNRSLRRHTEGFRLLPDRTGHGWHPTATAERDRVPPTGSADSSAHDRERRVCGPAKNIHRTRAICTRQNARNAGFACEQHAFFAALDRSRFSARMRPADRERPHRTTFIPSLTPPAAREAAPARATTRHRTS